jgi:hypothetical protein
MVNSNQQFQKIENLFIISNEQQIDHRYCGIIVFFLEIKQKQLKELRYIWFNMKIT